MTTTTVPRDVATNRLATLLAASLMHGALVLAAIELSSHPADLTAVRPRETGTLVFHARKPPNADTAPGATASSPAPPALRPRIKPVAITPPSSDVSRAVTPTSSAVSERTQALADDATGGSVNGADGTSGGAGGEDGDDEGADSGPGGLGGPVGDAPGPIAVNANVVPPRLLVRVAPRYPSFARSRRDVGRVILACVVEADGTVRVQDVKAGKEPFVAAAREAVEQWRYEPATLEGRPVAVYLMLRVEFAME